MTQEPFELPVMTEYEKPEGQALKMWEVNVAEIDLGVPAPMQACSEINAFESLTSRSKKSIRERIEEFDAITRKKPFGGWPLRGPFSMMDREFEIVKLRNKLGELD